MKEIPPLTFEPALYGPDWGSRYIDWMEGRLEKMGYSIKHDVEIPDLPSRVGFLAFRRRWELSAVGRLIRCVVAIHLPSVDIHTLEEYSSKVSDYAVELARQGSNRTGMNVLSCFVFPVVIADQVRPEVKDWVQSNTSERRWKAVDFRILVSGDDRHVYFCKKTPVWGAAYYLGLQRYAIELAAQQRV